MKKMNYCLFILLCVLLSISFSGKSQNILFEENFGNPASGTLVQNYTGWQNSQVLYSGDGTCDLRTTNPSQNYLNASGGGNIMLNNNTKWFQISHLNTLDYDSLQLHLGLRKSSIVENGSNLCIELSEDSILWRRLYMQDSLPIGNGTTGWYYLSFDSIPACQNLHLKFSNLGNTDFRLDDISITTTSVVPEYQVMPPTIIPNGGVYDEPVTITLTTSTTQAAIYYSLDDTEPNENSFLYSEPFQISHSCTLKVIAYKAGLNSSSVISAPFVIRSETPPVVLPFDISNNSSQEQLDITLMEGVTGAHLGASYSDGSAKFEQAKAGSASLIIRLDSAPDTLVFSVKGRKGGSAPQEYEGICFDILESPDSEVWHTMLSLSENDITTSQYTIFQLHCSSETRYIKWFLSAADKGNTQLNDICISKYTSTGNDTSGIQFSHPSYFKIFPNPASSFIHLESQEEEIISIEVLDNTGRIILRKKINEHAVFLSISHFSDGLYFIRIQTKEGTTVKKFVKNEYF